MGEAVRRLDLWNAGRAGGGGAVGRDDATGLDGLRPRVGLESARTRARGNAAAGSFGPAAARWEHCGVQHRQGRVGAETAGGATRRARSRNCARTGSREVESRGRLDSGIRCGVVEFQNEDLAVRMERAAGGGLGFFHGFVREEVGDFCDEASACERFFDVLALEVDIRIDLVSDAVVALVAFESNVVSSGADPKRFAVNLEGRFPNAEMVARSDHADGLSVGPAVILRAAK